MRNDSESVQIRGRYVLAVDDGNAYIAAGLAGMCVLWLPDYVAFPPNRHVSRKVRVFIEWVAELIAQHAPIADRGGS